MTTRTRNFIKEEEAVSPVIGVILMVAITVILAAVIGAFVFGMGGSLQKTYTVAATAAQTGSNTVDITFQGGPDADLVSSLNVTIGSVQYTAANADWANVSSTCIDPDVTSGASTFMTVTVGSMVTITDSTITTARDHVILTAEFADGSKQVILDTYV